MSPTSTEEYQTECKSGTGVCWHCSTAQKRYCAAVFAAQYARPNKSDAVKKIMQRWNVWGQ